MNGLIVFILFSASLINTVNGLWQVNGCEYVNGLIIECDGTKRRATPEEIALVKKHFTAEKAYFKKRFPPGFPFNKGPDNLIFPDFPHLCKTC
ncbi:unnamed protein product [Bursaphelenchus xylophilus]|nr:unnamed protein product [Bursaphelenchus xylophilus]CAG9120675.1 unnamed protein product [Bursaphelenchus xylophilus]